MLKPLRRIVSRIMLLVMLATFVSPSLSWGLVVTHEPSSHGISGSNHEELHGGHIHGYNHDEENDVQHENPHSYIGHLFTHMPAGLFSISTLVIQPQTPSKVAFLQEPFVTVDLAPPLRPPKPFLFL